MLYILLTSKQGYTNGISFRGTADQGRSTNRFLLNRRILPFLTDNFQKILGSISFFLVLVLLLNCKMTRFKSASSICLWQRFYAAKYYLLCGVTLPLRNIAYSAEYSLLCGVSLTLRSSAYSAEQRLLCGVSLTLRSIAYFAEYHLLCGATPILGSIATLT